MVEDKISPHFRRSEFACRCGCGFDSVVPALVFLLEAIREHFDEALTINSACRCRSHNREVGGASGSRHLAGEAADIVVRGVEPGVVADYCEELLDGRGGLGRYETFTHVDVRGYRARWRG